MRDDRTMRGRRRGTGRLATLLVGIIAVSVAAASSGAAVAAESPDVGGAAETLRVAGVGETATPQQGKTIVFLGDSLTAGYGLLPEEAFPSLIAGRLRDREPPFEVIDAGVPGDTSAGGLRRIDWLLRRRIDVLLLELGANDMLRGLPLELTRRNLQAIIDKTRAAYPDVKIVVAGMLAPPNLGPEYATEFAQIFPALAADNDAVLIPFLLLGVAARPELNLPDGIHPNAAGQQIVADLVWAALEPLLGFDGAAVPHGTRVS